MASDGAQAEKLIPGNISADIGRDIRAIRQSKGMTLTEMAVKLGRSIGYLSQVERGISELSTEELRQVAELFGVPLGWFLVLSDVSEEERGYITRAGLRRTSGDNEGGLAEELLSPDLSGSFEVIRSIFAPPFEALQADAAHDGGNRVHGVRRARYQHRQQEIHGPGRRQLPLQGRRVLLGEQLQ